ncbi:MAG: radical SAM protein [Chloroflexi bacterium]|nr:radical SAM protein [Chloroflexota bacterium]
MQYPFDAVVAVNYRCNARCLMCNIWEVQSGEQLSPSEFAKLPSTLRTINVSGGEPFLRDDLPDVIQAIKAASPNAKITISTNGLLTEKIVRTMRDVFATDRTIALGISIDGIDQKHDEVRGVRGAYRMATETLKRVRALGVNDLRIAFTASPANIDHFYRVYNLARELKVQFTCAVAHSSSHYFHSKSDLSPDGKILERQIGRIVNAELQTLSPKRWARAYFASGLARYTAGGGRPLPCLGGSAFFFLNPRGDIYPCNVLDVTMGNLREAPSFDDLWLSDDADAARGAVAACRKGCWMICTARAAMLQSKRKVAVWAIRSKVKAHMGLAVLDEL